jgi:hypothetical protein
MKGFRKEYPQRSECRQVAWWALGAIAGSDGFMDRTGAQLEAEEE